MNIVLRCSNLRLYSIVQEALEDYFDCEHLNFIKAGDNHVLIKEQATFNY